MKRTFLQLIAQTIVDKTSPLVKARTINIMDTDGIIIASNDNTRIGQLHSGAKKAAALAQNIEIYPSEVPQYIGAKEGINIPIYKSGQIIGVVGLFGNPDEVGESAALLSTTVTLLLEQYDKIAIEDLNKSIRNNLSSLLIQGNNSHSSLIIENLKKLRIPLNFPITPIVFQPEEYKSPIKYRVLQEKLNRSGFFKSNRDLLLKMVDGLYLILYQGSLSFDNIEDIFNKVSIGNPTYNINDLPYNSLLSLRLFECNNVKNIYYNNYDCYMNLFISDFGNIFRDKIIENMVNKLDNFGKWGRITIKEYLNSDGKINETARALNIHKNTCRYRIEKILSEYGFEECKLLTILFFFRMIINHEEKQ